MRGEEVDIKIRKPRAKETKPREQPERELRNNVIRELRRCGCKVKRIENSICGQNKSIADLLVFNPSKCIGGFLELKSMTGVLSKGKNSQEEFFYLCKTCGINCWLVRTVEEAKEFLLIENRAGGRLCNKNQ